MGIRLSMSMLVVTIEAFRKAGKDLVYYKRDDSTLEEDFFLRTAETLVPVEVKARGGSSKSLRTLISSEHYPDIRFGVKLHGGNIGLMYISINDVGKLAGLTLREGQVYSGFQGKNMSF